MYKVLAVLVALVICLSFSAPCSMAKVTTKDAIITKAKQAVEKYGIVYEGAEIIYDKDTKKWEERVLVIEKEPANPNYGILPHGILLNKRYEVVLFDFKEGARKGDVWVFVDPVTTNILTIYQEK